VHELVFNEREKDALMELPGKRYQIMDISTRKVSHLAQISYRHNYYSVPAKYVGMQVRLESNGTLLKIYSNRSRIALHSISHAMGLYISVEEHKPEYKRIYKQREILSKYGCYKPLCSPSLFTVGTKSSCILGGNDKRDTQA